MPIRYEKRYDPEFCRAHPEWLVVFGDNLARYGKGGQAIIRDEPNAVGIPTKRKPSMQADAFFTDGDIARFIFASVPKFSRLAEHLMAGGTVVWPTDGIGTGLASLERSAPQIWSNLQAEIGRLQRLSPPALSTSEG